MSAQHTPLQRSPPAREYLAAALSSVRRVRPSGDVENQLRHLQSQLMGIGYPEHVPATAEELAEAGKCETLLPVLGHLFLGGYSKFVAQKVSKDRPRMFAQSDSEFVHSVFHFVKQAFGFRPQLNPDQFLNKRRFVEQSVIFANSCVVLCRAFHKEHLRRTKQHAQGHTGSHGKSSSMRQPVTSDEHRPSNDDAIQVDRKLEFFGDQAEEQPREQQRCPQPVQQAPVVLHPPVPFNVTRHSQPNQESEQRQPTSIPRQHSEHRQPTSVPHQHSEYRHPTTYVQPPNHTAVDSPNQESALARIVSLVQKMQSKMDSSLEEINARLSILEERLERTDNAVASQGKQIQKLMLAAHSQSTGPPLTAYSFEFEPQNSVDDPWTSRHEAHFSSSDDARAHQQAPSAGANNSEIKDPDPNSHNTQSEAQRASAPTTAFSSNSLCEDTESLAAMIARRIQESQELLNATRSVLDNNETPR